MVTYNPKWSSIMHEAPQEHCARLHALMVDKFRGYEKAIPVQSKENKYYPNTHFDSWSHAVKLHLEHKNTIGIYHVAPCKRAWTFSLDIDDHEQMVLNLPEKIVYVANNIVKRHNLSYNNLLIEDTGRGYHIFMRLPANTPALPADAIRFMEEIQALAYKNPEGYSQTEPSEIKPPEVKPTSENLRGNLTRMPLGCHRQRIEDKDNYSEDWRSLLCRYDGVSIERVKDIEGAIEILEAWEPIPLNIIQQNVGTTLRQLTPQELAEVPSMLKDEIQCCNMDCIKNLLSNMTLPGNRNNYAFVLARYFVHGRRLPHEQVEAVMELWRKHCTQRTSRGDYTKARMMKTVRVVFNKSYNLSCRVTKQLIQLCLEREPGAACDFERIRNNPRPIDKDIYRKQFKGTTKSYPAAVALKQLLQCTTPDANGTKRITRSAWWDEYNKIMDRENPAYAKTYRLTNERSIMPWLGRIKKHGVIKSYTTKNGVKYIEIVE